MYLKKIENPGLLMKLDLLAVRADTCVTDIYEPSNARGPNPVLDLGDWTQRGAFSILFQTG